MCSARSQDSTLRFKSLAYSEERFKASEVGGCPVLAFCNRHQSRVAQAKTHKFWLTPHSELPPRPCSEQLQEMTHLLFKSSHIHHLVPPPTVGRQKACPQSRTAEAQTRVRFRHGALVGRARVTKVSLATCAVLTAFPRQLTQPHLVRYAPTA